jgi:hypothetical protein
MRFLNIPPLEQGTDGLLIAPQKLHIDVVMVPCLHPKKEVKRPATGDPPGNYQ